MSNNPMRPEDRLFRAKRCGAKSKRSGDRCKGPAMNGWSVCRMHGARGGAPFGKRNPRYRHGNRTREIIEMRRELSELLREARDLCGSI